MTYFFGTKAEEEEYEKKVERYWKKLKESPENQLYQKFCGRYGADRRLPTSIKETPLIGLRKTRDPFEIDRDYYFKAFFLFKPETPSMKCLSLDQAIKKDLRFLGKTPIISWENWNRAEKLFCTLGKFFKNREIPPDYFLVNFSADSDTRSKICPYDLTFFGKRK